METVEQYRHQFGDFANLLRLRLECLSLSAAVAGAFYVLVANHHLCSRLHHVVRCKLTCASPH